jgi:hypothetical protein
MLRLVAALLIALLAGCVAPVPRLPEARSAAIAVARGQDFDVALQTGDYWIPDSQVFIGGRDGATAVGGAFGLLGMAIGGAIDRERNASSLQDMAKALTINFDRRVFEDIARRIVADTSGHMRLVRPDDPQAQVLLVSYARFQAVDDSPPLLTFSLQARTGERTRAGYSQRKTYSLQLAQRRRIKGAGGWADNNGALFDSVATTSFERLVDAFMLDLRGELPLPAAGASAPRIRWRATNYKGEPAVISGVVLREMPEYVIAAPVSREAVAQHGMYVVERALLVE